MQKTKRKASEYTLVEALAFAINQRLRHILCREEYYTTLPDKYLVDHVYQTCFEYGCEVLWQLGLTEAFDPRLDKQSTLSIKQQKALKAKIDPTINFPPFFAIHSDSEFKEELARQILPEKPSIEYIIDTYLRLATGYGDAESILPSPRGEPFSTTHPEKVAPMEAFVTDGYAGKINNLYQWTDKIAHSMIDRNLWSTKHFDVSSCNAAKISKHAQDILSFIEGRNGETDLWNYWGIHRAQQIIRYWNGEELLDHAIKIPHISFEDALAISFKLDEEP